MSIDDPVKRRRALEAINRCAENPDSKPEESDCKAVNSVTGRICLKAERRRAAAARRKARRKEIESGLSEKSFNLPADDFVLRRLLWVKQHYSEWVDQVTRALRELKTWKLGTHIAESLQAVTDLVYTHLKPMIEAANNIIKRPRRNRPSHVPVLLPV